MCRSVFADGDGIVREDIKQRQFRKRGNAHGRTHIVFKGQERRSRRFENSGVSNAVQNRAHGVFANAEPDVAPGVVVDVKISAVFDVGFDGAEKVCATGKNQRIVFRKCVEGNFAGNAGRVLIFAECGNLCGKFFRRAVVTRKSFFEQSSELRISFLPSFKRFRPCGVFRFAARAKPGEIFARFRGNVECCFRKSETLVRVGGKFGSAFAVSLRRSRDFGNSAPDERFANNQLRASVAVFPCAFKGRKHFDDIVPVFEFPDVPICSLKAIDRVFVLRFFGRRVERNRVGIVEKNQVIQAEASGDGGGFVGNAFLQASVAAKTDDDVVENLVFFRIEAGCCHFFGNCHTDDVADALPERSRRCFHAGRIAEFRVPGRQASAGTKRLQIINRKLESREVQPSINKHTAVSGGKHETVAIRPFRVLRSDFQGVSEKRGTDFRRSERKSQVSGFATGDGVQREAAGFVCRARKSRNVWCNRHV